MCRRLNVNIFVYCGNGKTVRLYFQNSVCLAHCVQCYIESANISLRCAYTITNSGLWFLGLFFDAGFYVQPDVLFFTEQPSSQQLVAGSDLTLSCGVRLQALNGMEGGLTVPVVSWRVNGTISVSEVHVYRTAVNSKCTFLMADSSKLWKAVYMEVATFTAIATCTCTYFIGYNKIYNHTCTCS